MNLLLLHHPPPPLDKNHHQVYFQIRTKVNNRNPCVSRNERLGMRCCSSSSRGGGGREARDRIITFGKYKGEMLGSIPSGYLKWVSSNLRAGDSEEWAKLADQVLQDPIYRDRIEWEIALNVLNGNNNNNLRGSSAVSLLLDISNRFGWDYHDKLAWSKVDFDLLGTSKGARIPRLAPQTQTHTHTHTHTHPHPHPHPHRPTSITSTRRMQRRDRQKKKTTSLRLKTPQLNQAQPQKQDTKNTDNGEMVRHNHNENENENAIANPFPGRQALLTNLLHNHKMI